MCIYKHSSVLDIKSKLFFFLQKEANGLMELFFFCSEIEIHEYRYLLWAFVIFLPSLMFGYL